MIGLALRIEHELTQGTKVSTGQDTKGKICCTMTYVVILKKVFQRNIFSGEKIFMISLKIVGHAEHEQHDR